MSLQNSKKCSERPHPFFNVFPTPKKFAKNFLQKATGKGYYVHMAKVDEQFKAKLLESGQWPDFVLRRNDFQSQGMTPADARRAAMLEFGVDETVIKKQRRPKKVPENLETSTAVVEGATKANTEKPKLNFDGVDIAAGVAASMKSYMCDRDDFGGRECSRSEQVSWVARNMGINDVTKDECPDPAAWFLLMACRESVSFRVDVFWKTMFSRGIPTKEIAVEEDDPAKFDGHEIANLCDVLVECGGVAEEGKV